MTNSLRKPKIKLKNSGSLPTLAISLIYFLLVVGLPHNSVSLAIYRPAHFTLQTYPLCMHNRKHDANWPRLNVAWRLLITQNYNSHAQWQQILSSSLVECGNVTVPDVCNTGTWATLWDVEISCSTVGFNRTPCYWYDPRSNLHSNRLASSSFDRKSCQNKTAGLFWYGILSSFEL